jgi:peroxiredoxin Q/BCP
MTHLTVGQIAPDFSATDENGRAVSLSDFSSRYVVLYFYPKDDTPGCTKQACSFRDNIGRLQKNDIVVLGVSRNNAKDHKKFIEKYDLNFPLLVDEDGSLCESYGAWVEKSMYGKTYMGVSRITFIIDPNGKIAHIFQKVDVDSHAVDVEKVILSLKKSA